MPQGQKWERGGIPKIWQILLQAKCTFFETEPEDEDGVEKKQEQIKKMVNLQENRNTSCNLTKIYIILRKHVPLSIDSVVNYK